MRNKVSIGSIAILVASCATPGVQVARLGIETGAVETGAPFDLATEIQRCNRARLAEAADPMLTASASVAAACSIEVPAGSWATPSMRIDFPVHIRGVPLAAMDGTWLSTLTFLEGGLELHGRDTRIEHLTLRGVLQRPGIVDTRTHHGISVRARAHFDHVVVTRFSGTGIDMNLPDALTNVNLSRLRDVKVVRNGGPGIRIRGEDANAMTLVDLDARQNCWFSPLCANIWASSNIGNVWFAPTTQTCYVGGLAADAINAQGGGSGTGPACKWTERPGTSTICTCRAMLFDNAGGQDTLIWPYVETDQLPPLFVQESIVIGGHLAKESFGNPLLLRRGMPLRLGVGSAPGIVFGTEASGERTVQIGFGGRPPKFGPQYGLNDLWVFQDTADVERACAIAKCTRVTVTEGAPPALTWKCVAWIGAVVE